MAVKANCMKNTQYKTKGDFVCSQTFSGEIQITTKSHRVWAPCKVGGYTGHPMLVRHQRV